MIETTAINLINNEPMMVTWDTGRRCNYDCSYCEITRHDNKSPHHTLEEYIKTFEFIKNGLKFTTRIDNIQLQST